MSYFCQKCQRSYDGQYFYTSRNLEKFPNDGKLNLCKKCLTMHIDNWEPSTFVPILEMIDVPYVPNEWNKILHKYADQPEKITGMTILGRYLSIMRMKQWSKYRYADTEAIEAERQEKLRQSYEAEGELGEEEIEEKVKETIAPPERPELPEPVQVEETKTPDELPAFAHEDEYADKLTDEDKAYLRLKWGYGYRCDEWVRLEQLYNQMKESYDIQTAGHEDTLILICKTSLKCNQAIDAGDIEGFQKLSKVYDSLMKSGRFTAAQNKNETGNCIDSVAELVAMCEKDGFIPRFYIEKPNDKVDRVLEDLKGYTRSLVTEEMNLGDLIEKAIKQISIDQQNKNNSTALEDDPDSMEENLFKEQTITDFRVEDRLSLIEMQEQMQEEDRELEVGEEIKEEEDDY